MTTSRVDVAAAWPRDHATPAGLPEAQPLPDDEPSGSSPEPAARSRWAGLLLGPSHDPSWARPALLLLLVGTLAVYTYNLTANGWANAFYSAAVQAGSQNWEAFFFGSSDAANSITVDKTPAALWVMALSVRVFGLNSFAILFPQVLMGVGTVALVYYTVKRYAGPGAGLVAGLAMASTPVAVLMFRFNNPDALLVLLMTAATTLTLRACERGNGRLLALAGVLLGLGFLTKMLQVFLVLPALAAVYLVAANTSLGKRVVHGLAAVAALVLTAGWWIAIVELVPASMRPYIGGSQTNSILELTLGYNGLGRLNGEEVGSVGPGQRWGSVGLGRMFSDSIGGQISWLLPAALLLLVVGLLGTARAPRTDLRRASYLAWGGWLIVTAGTFSFMAGIFHEYYTVALAPAIAALVGLGVGQAWQRRHALVGSLTLALTLALTAAWSFILLSRTTEYPDALRWTVLVGGLVVAFGLLFSTQLPRWVGAALVAAAVLVGIAGPAAYAATTVTTAKTGSIITAGPNSGGPGAGPGAGGPMGAPPGGTAAGPGFTPPGTGTATGGTGSPGAAGTGAPSRGAPGTAGGGRNGLLNASEPSAELVALLSSDSSSYTWVAAAVGSQTAAGLQLGTQLPVMSVGGFNGSDPSPTLQQFQQLVADGEIHYFVGGSGFGGSNGGASDSAQIAAWVNSTFTATTIDGTTVYDLTGAGAASGTGAGQAGA
ncbi:MAG: glycosyltransferase family 39 protein [Actinomycetales bacterium]